MKKLIFVMLLAVVCFNVWSNGYQGSGNEPQRTSKKEMTIPVDTLSRQEFDPHVPIEFASRNMGGPRLGVTYIPGKGKMVEELKKNEIGQTISQFGWHFEYAVIPKGGGPSFVIEFIPLVGGVEYGKLIPSATLAMGVRLPSGIEFGMGPNGLFTGDDVNSSLVLALGKSFNYSGVSIPINLVFATNPDGNRFSVIFGYAIAK